MVDRKKIQEAKDFYNDRIISWMLGDLKKSIAAETNFLTALGCFVYTEVIGIFLPSIKQEKGKEEEKRFYRCFFRLKSKYILNQLDKEIYKATNKGIYQNLRHSMAHRYFPAIKRREKDGKVSFIPSGVARDGFLKKINGKKYRAAPIGFNTKGWIIIATKNYLNELEEAVNMFYDETFNKHNSDYEIAAVKGIDLMLRDKQ